MIDPLIAYLARDRAAQVLSGAPLAAEGMALIADLAGFTALAESLARALSPARGAEELTAALNRVFAPLIAAIHRHGGSVIKFGGDALVVWFPRPPHARRSSVARRALACAARLQAIMAAAGQVATAAGSFTLSMKIGMAYGPALRVRLGDPTHGYEDVLGGATLDRMAEAEHQAGPGEIILDPTGLDQADLPPALEHRAGFLVVDTAAVAPWRGRHGFKLELLDEGRRTKDQRPTTNDQGPTTEDQGPRMSDQGPRAEDQGPGTRDQRPRAEDQGPRMSDQGPRAEDQGPRMSDQGPRAEDQGPRTKGQGAVAGDPGRVGADLPLTSDEEVGQIGPSSLVFGLQPSLAPGPQRSDLLRPYLPPEVFQAVREGRSQPAELKPVVSIFVQFQGISYESPAAEAQLGAYFSLAQRAAARYGGRVNRLITGDKGSLLHLIFGAPRALEELEQRAARCALEICAIAGAIPYLSAQRIGMAFGRAFAGPVGSDERRDYTVIGDTINLSARLMQRAAPGQVVIDGELAARLTGFTMEDLGAAQLKGKAMPVPLFALISEGDTRRVARPLSLLAGRAAEQGALRERLTALQRGQGGVAILIGELGMGKTHLLGRLREGGDGGTGGPGDTGAGGRLPGGWSSPAPRPSPSPFSGGWSSPDAPLPNPSPTRGEEPPPHQDAVSPPSPARGRGGKGVRAKNSSQPHESLRRSGALSAPSPTRGAGGRGEEGAAGSLRWAFASAPAYGAQPSGGLIGAALRELLGEAPEAALRELLGERRGAAAWPYVARLLGLPLDERQARELEAVAGESLRWRLFGLIPELLEAFAARAPLALALDDLQWADPTSLELVEALIPLAERAPLLLLLASRPDRESRAWQIFDRLGGRATRVELGPLEVAEAAAIIAHHAPGLPAAAQARLAERGGGNPLFLVELARAAALAGPEAELPDSIQGLLLAQIDRLPPAEREALQVAAVLGPSVEAGLLGALLEDNDDEGRGAGKPGRSLRPHRFTPPPALTHQHLESLAAAGFLLREGAGYRFRHALIAESAYGALLYERRRGYHRAAAGLIERREVARLAELSGAIARHYELAGELGPAARYHGQAADGARLLYANAEAEAGYRHVLDLLERGAADEGLCARTYLKLAQVRMNAGDYAAAQELYDQAFTLLEQAEQQQPPSRRRRKPPVFRMGADEPETLDPAMVETTAAEVIVSNLFEGLVELDEDLNVIPAAARRWRIEDEGRRYIFELRPGLRWSDGTPLTAHDFVFAWRRNLDPATKSPAAHQLYIITGAQEIHNGHANSDQLGSYALNELTIEIELVVSTGYLLALMAEPIAYPQPTHSIRTHGNTWADPDRVVCNGAYCLREWQPKQQITLTKNDYFTGLMPGNIDKAVFFMQRTGIPAYQDNVVDWIALDRMLLDSDISGIITTTEYAMSFFLLFSLQSQPFNNILARQAFALCIDQADLVERVTMGIQRPANGGIVPLVLPGFTPGIGLEYAPHKAKELLDRADPALRSMKINLAALPGMQTPHYLVDCWREHLGIEVNLRENVPMEEIVAQVEQGETHIALLAWECEYPDPDAILRVVFHSASPYNFFGWHNETFDRLVERASLLTDHRQRMNLYHQADTLLVQEHVVVVPLFYYRTLNLLRAGFQVASGGRMFRGYMPRLKDIVAL